jgi:hypothetical protein
VTAVDVLGFWFPLSGAFAFGLLWLCLKDTLRAAPGGRGESGDDGGGGSDRVAPPPRPPWSWHRRGDAGPHRGGGPGQQAAGRVRRRGRPVAR